MSFKRISFFICFSLFVLSTRAQGIVPTLDFNKYFVSFQDGFFRPIEIQPIVSYKAGDEIVAYIDTRGNLKIYDGKERIDVTTLNVDYQVSDHLMAYRIAQGLRMWDAGKFTVLTNFGREYVVKDSLIVFEDIRYQALNVYWNQKVESLVTITNGVSMNASVGENLVVYKDNSNTYFVYWHGQKFEIGTYNEEVLDFQLGTDVMCFKDPYTQSFYVFDQGNFLELESFPIKKYKAGRGFVVYEDMNGNLWHYQNGQKTALSNFSSELWDVKDDICVWMENSYFFAYTNGQRVQVATYQPQAYLLKNNVLVYRNIIGGVSALVDGVSKEITNFPQADFEIYGSKVLVKLPNQTSVVLMNGKLYAN
ncbi:MAG: hypothetical protein RL762_883 [Bacteroidota bacterium]|jgi:hypothetical protein